MGSKAHTWQKRLASKGKAFAMREKLGSHVAVVTRTKSNYADKAVALRTHQTLIKGQDYVMKDGREVCWAVNPTPRVTDVKKDGSEQATTFRGDGLPEEVIRNAKSNAERAAADKRAPLKDEMRAGWKPKRFGARKLERRERFG